MDNPQVISIIKQHVAARLAKAAELQIKASWATEHHLDMLNEILGLAQNSEQRRDLLGKHYNVSQFQQELDREFKGTGHFARENKLTKLRKTYLSDLALEAAKQ